MTDLLARLTDALADRYAVERELGAGGMATVYLARDLRHDREVAVKVVHPDLGAALGGERFLAEIRTTAKLQHPHILPLLDSGDAGNGLLYYVMPFVRGETLRARLERDRQLPIPEALRVAREVAVALDHAHKQGIVHRDIKPENILLQDGSTLVADFGIALAVQSAGGQRMTQTGLSLGTPQYMSPEQAMGEKTVDARSDLYALGAVCYEMLAGEPPFTGASVQAIVARVLTEKPTPISTFRDTVPPALERVVLSALAKLPADRPASAAAFAEALREDGAMHTDGSRVAPVRPVASRAVLRASVGAALAATAVTALVAWAVLRNGGSASPADALPARFVLEQTPEDYMPILLGQHMTIAPDGSAIVWVSSDVRRGARLRLRRIGELGSTDAVRTSGRDPAISPDGAWLAYYDAGALWKVQLAGGPPSRIAAATEARGSGGMVWSATDELVYGRAEGLMAVPADGGAVRRLAVSPDSSLIQAPVALAGTNLLAVRLRRSGKRRSTLAIVSLKDGRIDDLDVEGVQPLGISAGHLLWVTVAGEILAAPFDVNARRLTGRAVRVETGVFTLPGNESFAYAALSANGHLVYHDRSGSAQLVMRTRDGQVTPLLPDTLAFEFPRLSPDGRRIALTVTDRDSRLGGVWVLDRERRILSRVTPPSSEEQRDRQEWSADGRALLYRKSSPSGISVGIRPVEGGDERVLASSAVPFNEAMMAGDGRTMLARVNDLDGQHIYRWQIGDTTKTALFRDAKFVTGPRFSPDQQWIAWSDQPSDGRHVYVGRTSGAGTPVRIDVDGGGAPVWRRDGRALLYSDGAGIVEATLAFTPEPSVTGVRRVVDGGYDVNEVLHAMFDVDADGSLILVRPVRAPRTIVVRNFDALVRERTAAASAGSVGR